MKVFQMHEIKVFERLFILYRNKNNSGIFEDFLIISGVIVGLNGTDCFDTGTLTALNNVKRKTVRISSCRIFK